MRNSLKHLLIFLSLLNICCILFLFGDNFFKRSQPFQILTATHSTPDYYTMKNPKMADKVFSLLDVYKPIGKKYSTKVTRPEYSRPYMGLVKDREYCINSKKAFIESPHMWFTEMFTMTDFYTNGIPRQLIDGIQTDVMPFLISSRNDSFTEKYKIRLSPYIQNIFLNHMYHQYLIIGKNFGCVTQMYNHIPGHFSVSRKDFAAGFIASYADKYENRTDCFNFNKFFPKTWLLHHKDHCEDFFNNHLNVPEYWERKAKEGIVYIRKLGSGPHMGKGVQPMDDQEESDIRTLYQNGSLCG